MTSEPSFKALVVSETAGKLQANIQQVEPSALPDGDVLVRVAYSSLNYKDGMAVTGAGKVIRRYPMVPGIDFAGVVEASSSDAYKPGDEVILTGWGVGERHWGGYAELARVQSGWLVPLPMGLSLQQAMAIGTAGLTAMLCVLALEAHGLASGRPIVVTGAAGGVGSVAVAVLAQLGHYVVASTGRAAAHEYLRSLGAQEIIGRDVLAAPGKPLDSERWGGAVDSVGGETLAGLLRSMAYGSSIAACGLAGGAGLTTTVMPFILRGVNLLGIDSVQCPYERRVAAWQRLAENLPLEKLDKMTQIASLEEIPALAAKIIAGQVRGRIVIDLQAGGA